MKTKEEMMMFVFEMILSKLDEIPKENVKELYDMMFLAKFWDNLDKEINEIELKKEKRIPTKRWRM